MPDLNSLKKSALSGSVSAVQALEHLVVSGDLSTSDLCPVLEASMALKHIMGVDTDDWTTSPPIANVISCFGMIAAGLAVKHGPTYAPSFSLDTMASIWSLVQEWCIVFIDRIRVTNHPRDIFLAEVIERVLLAAYPILDFQILRVMGSTRYRSRSKVFLQRVTLFWSQCAACPSIPTPSLMPFICKFLDVEKQPDLTEIVEDTLLWSASCDDISSALETCYAIETMCPKIDPKAIESIVSLTLFFTQSRSREHVQSLLSHSIVFYMVKLLRRVTSRRLEIRANSDPGPPLSATVTVVLTILDLPVLRQRHEYFWVRETLRGNIVHALLNTDLFLHSKLTPQEVVGPAGEVVARLLAAIRPYLIWPGVRAFARKGLRSIEQSGILTMCDADSLAMHRFVELKRDVEVLSANEEIPNLRCRNSECLLSLDEQHLVKLKRCSGCRHFLYCSTTCQAAHWTTGHRQYCHDVERGRIESQYVSLRSVCDEEWIQHRAHHDLGQRWDECQDLIRGGDVLVMDYRAYAEKHKVELSAVPAGKCGDYWKTLLKVPAELKEYLGRAGDGTVLILGPFTNSEPYSQLTTLDWMRGLQY